MIITETQKELICKNTNKLTNKINDHYTNIKIIMRKNINKHMKVTLTLQKQCNQENNS